MNSMNVIEISSNNSKTKSYLAKKYQDKILKD